MADDYYPNPGNDQAAPSEAPEEGAMPATETGPEEKEEQPHEDGETALLPKTILAGKEFKPGEEVVLKIVHIYDDEVEVAYATGEGGEGGGGESETPMDKATNKLRSMAGSGGGY